MQEPEGMSDNIVSGSPKDGGRKSGERGFSTSDKEMLLRTASGDSAGSNNEPSLSGPHEKTKTTLFNIRLATTSKPVRLSDKFEDDEEELQPEAAEKAATKSEPLHVTWDPSAEEDPQQLVFVQHKAVKFGHGMSSTDFSAQDIDGDADDNDESLTSSVGNNSPDITVAMTSKDFFSKDKQEGGVHFSKGKSDPLNRSFIKDKLASPLRKKRGSASDPKTSEKSPLLGKPTSRASPVSSIDSSLLHPASNGDEDNPMISPLRSEESSEDESQYLNTSEEADNVLSPSIMSDDVTAACSKYSQLSEDGSSPSSPAKSIPVAGEDAEDGAGPEAFKERDMFEHSLELGVAFTEFVDVDNFRASLGKKNPHTEDTFGGRSEEHLVVLLKGGSRKPLKSYLRNSQLPAESDARRNMWENICTHLLKAGGHLFQEILDEHLSPGTDDVGLPAIVDLDHQHFYFLTSHGVKAAKTVVTVIANLSPDIIYCPMLLPMSSLFLHYMSPESCFNCMQALLSSTRPQYFTQTTVKLEASKYVLRDLSKKYTKQAYALMARSAKSVESVFDNWMWWIFRDLPFQYLVRIIDSFLLEGYKVLYRMALAIVFLFTKESSQHGNRNSPVTNISAAISRFCVNMPHEPKKLIKVGFGIRGLTRKEIAKLHDKNEAYIRNLPAKDSIQKVVSSPSMGQISIARSFQQGTMLSKQSGSAILSPEMLSTVWSWIPMRLTLKRPKLLFSSEVHGTALRTLYTKSDHAPQTILVIKTTDDEIFGAYCSSPWFTRHEKNKIHTSFFGTGETFVFTLQPRIEKYPWTGALGYPPDRTADHFMAGDDHLLIIGSGNGEAIYLDTMMERCTSTHCDTFDNDPLTSTTDFTCRVVEVFGFID